MFISLNFLIYSIINFAEIEFFLIDREGFLKHLRLKRKIKNKNEKDINNARNGCFYVDGLRTR